MSEETLKVSGRKCPVCSKPTQEKWKPFCSKRCADVDLNRWLSGGYVIPGAPADLEEDSPPLAPDDDKV